jgi:hypothetical protein
MRMQPTMGGPGVLANGVEAGPHVTRAVARWLESRNVQQYHQGLLVAVLISCGLWKDSMWEPLENGALRWVCWALCAGQGGLVLLLAAVGVCAQLSDSAWQAVLSLVKQAAGSNWLLPAWFPATSSIH